MSSMAKNLARLHALRQAARRPRWNAPRCLAPVQFRFVDLARDSVLRIVELFPSRLEAPHASRRYTTRHPTRLHHHPSIILRHETTKEKHPRLLLACFQNPSACC